jgi:RecA/RadA recombinase
MGRKPKAEKAATSGAAPEKILSNFLNEDKNKIHHHNFEEEEDYKVSTGSLLLDIATGGGIGPGLHRFCGINEGGKTSEALEVCRNFLSSIPKGRAMLIKAEGRLSPEMKKRCGVDFVSSPEDWKDGTCFVLESNVYEVVFTLMRDLVYNNSEDIKYCFIVDSVDGLTTLKSMDVPFEKSDQVASGATISSVFMKKTANNLSKRGHMAIFISQVRAKIEIQGKITQTTTSATGGNDLLHFANWILEFERPWQKDLIKEKPNDPVHKDTNKILGHWVNVKVKKSPNEMTDYTIQYPVKRGRKNRSSIWLEKEVTDQMEKWGFVKKSGAWYTASEEIIQDMKERGLDIPEKFHGEKKLFEFLESNPNVVEALMNKFKDLLSSIQTDIDE